MSTFNADAGNDIVFEYGAFASDGFTFLPSESISLNIYKRASNGDKLYYDFGLDDGTYNTYADAVSISGVMMVDLESETYYYVWNPRNEEDFYTARIINDTEGSVAKSKKTDTINVTAFKRHR